MVVKSSLGVVAKAEELMSSNDASHDAWHVLRVRNLALSLAREEGLSSDPDSIGITFEESLMFSGRRELAALLNDIDDYKYLRDPSEKNLVENLSNKDSRKARRLRY